MRYFSSLREEREALLSHLPSPSPPPPFSLLSLSMATINNGYDVPQTYDEILKVQQTKVKEGNIYLKQVLN